MATTEERLAALEAKLAALTATTPTEYYTHQYSGEEIDAAVGRALTGGALDTSVTNVSNQLETLVRPNLLDNWYFGRPVNQRGETEWTAANSYTIDRWKRAGSGKMSFVDGGIKCEDVYLHQFFEKGFLGKGTYTISVLTKNPSGDFFAVFGFWGAGVDKSFHVTLDNGFATVTFTVAENHDDYNPFIYLGLQNTFLAAKLELGPTQTLAHQENGVWVLNEVPDYGEQLRRCQRYCFVTNANHFFSGWCTQTNKFWTCIPTPVPLRAKPIISVIAPGTLISGTPGANYSTSAGQYEIENADSAGIKMAVNIDTTALTMGAGVLCDGKYVFSADL